MTIVLAFEVIISIIVVLLLLYAAVRYRKEITSEKGKEEAMRRKGTLRIALFLGVIALAMFIIWEIFEALEALGMVSLEERVEHGINAVIMLTVLAAQILVLYISIKVKTYAG